MITQISSAQVVLDESRRIVAHGIQHGYQVGFIEDDGTVTVQETVIGSIGAEPTQTIVDLPPVLYAHVLTLLEQIVGDGAVTLAEDQTLTVVSPSPAWQAAEDARVAEQQALTAAIAAHPDPLYRALAARVGLG